MWKTCDIEDKASVAVFGLGAVGLAVIQAAKERGARRIFAIDLNPKKFDLAKKFGATDCLNPTDYDEPIQSVLVGETQWGVDYTFDCTGNTEVRPRTATTSPPSSNYQPQRAPRMLSASPPLHHPAAPPPRHPTTPPPHHRPTTPPPHHPTTI